MNNLIAKDLICYWDFASDNPLNSQTQFAYTLKKHGNINFNPNTSMCLAEGEYLSISREDCPALNIHGKDAQVTVFAWIKRQPKRFIQCEAIAGMWNETEKKRQYCLFLNLRLSDSADQVCGHISSVGGATPGQQWCIDASIGKTAVDFHNWTFVAFTYNGKFIKSYHNGILDRREKHNPYFYDEGIFDGKELGSDFTIGAVHRLGEMGNDFVGEIANLGVFNRALTEVEIQDLYLLKKDQFEK